MRRRALQIAIICTLAIMLTCTLARAHDNAHTAVSAVLGGFSLMAVDIIKPDWSTYKKVLVAGTIALIPGLIKEATDAHFDWRDMGSNAIGAFGGTAMVATITIRW